MKSNSDFSLLPAAVSIFLLLLCFIPCTTVAGTRSPDPKLGNIEPAVELVTKHPGHHSLSLGVTGEFSLPGKSGLDKGSFELAQALPWLRRVIDKYNDAKDAKENKGRNDELANLKKRRDQIKLQDKAMMDYIQSRENWYYDEKGLDILKDPTKPPTPDNVNLEILNHASITDADREKIKKCINQIQENKKDWNELDRLVDKTRNINFLKSIDKTGGFISEAFENMASTSNLQPRECPVCHQLGCPGPWFCQGKNSTPYDK